MIRRHGLNLEGECWWCGRGVPYPCNTYTHAEKVIADYEAAQQRADDVAQAGDPQ